MMRHPMRQTRQAVWGFVVLTAMLLISACEPVGPLPGRALSGEEAKPPESWQALNDVEVVQLETVGPYSVNIWGVALDDDYYVASADGLKTRWAQQIAKDDKVRLRIGDKIYPLRAVVVGEAEQDRVAAAYARKYDDMDSAEDFPDVVVFRLEPR